MAVEITLAQFNKIAIGDYNAGFVDFKTDDQGNVLNELRKVNNHVHMRGKNKEEISPERVLQVKEAFVEAMRRGKVSEESIKAIRQELGIPTLFAESDAASEMLEKNFSGKDQGKILASMKIISVKELGAGSSPAPGRS